MTDIIHTTELDKHTCMVISDVPINAPERYIWNIHFLDDDGEAYGRCSEGVWFDSVAAAIAAGRTYYLMELARDKD